MWAAMSSRWTATWVLAAVALLSTAWGAPVDAVEVPADSTGGKAHHGYFDASGWVMLRSGLIPGWGQAKNGRWLKATIVAGIEVALFERLHFEQGRIDYYCDRASELPCEDQEKYDYYMSKVERHEGHRKDFIWWTSLTILLSMGDAYVDAQLRDFDVDLQYEPEPGSEGNSGGSPAPGGAGGMIRLSFGRHF
jgi:hypothetical protein